IRIKCDHTTVVGNGANQVVLVFANTGAAMIGAGHPSVYLDCAVEIGHRAFILSDLSARLTAIAISFSVTRVKSDRLIEVDEGEGKLTLLRTHNAAVAIWLSFAWLSIDDPVEVRNRQIEVLLKPIDQRPIVICIDQPGIYCKGQIAIGERTFCIPFAGARYGAIRVCQSGEGIDQPDAINACRDTRKLTPATRIRSTGAVGCRTTTHLHGPG